MWRVENHIKDKDGNEIIVDPWSQKNSSDFLHYLKFEFMQYTFFGSYLQIPIAATFFYDDFVDFYKIDTTNILPDESKLTFLMCILIHIL